MEKSICVCRNIDMVALKRERERKKCTFVLHEKKSAELGKIANKNCISQMKINQQFE